MARQEDRQRAAEAFRLDVEDSDRAHNDWDGSAIVIATILEHMPHAVGDDIERFIGDASIMARDLLAQSFPDIQVPITIHSKRDLGALITLAEVFEANGLPTLGRHVRASLAWLNSRETGGGEAIASGPNSLRPIEAMAESITAYNAAPQTDLNGLSPDQIDALLIGDWRTMGALRISTRVELTELAGAPLLHDARMILAHLADDGPLKATASGNLSRAAVAVLRPKLRSDHDYLDSGMFKVVNEEDISDLWLCRNLLGLAGLIARRAGTFRITKRGRELLPETNAGELFALLFTTLFRRFDLRALSRSVADEAGLQTTIACTLYRLSQDAGWHSADEWAERAWIDAAKDAPTVAFAGGPLLRRGDSWIFVGRVLEPLTDLGLMEVRDRATSAVHPPKEYRLTPLFRRFIHFDFPPPSQASGGIEPPSRFYQ